MAARSTFSLLIAFLGVVADAAHASATHEIDMTDSAYRPVGKSRMNESGNAATARGSQLFHMRSWSVAGKRVRHAFIRTRRVAHSYHCRHCVRTSGYRLLSATHVLRHGPRHPGAKSESAAPGGKVMHAERGIELQRCAEGCEEAGAHAAAVAVVLPGACDGACSVGEILTTDAEQNASTLETTIASNVALADQTDGAAKLMLLMAATPSRAAGPAWSAAAPPDQTIAAMKY
jgi:hypothetical protein